MASRKSFEDGLRDDTVKRFRAAMYALADRALDVEVERKRAGGDARKDLRDELSKLESHMYFLRDATAECIVTGHVYIGSLVKAALAAAERPRRAPAPPKPPAPPAKPAQPPRPRSYKVDLSAADRVARAAGGVQVPASLPSARRAPALPAPAQEPLFGRPLMLPMPRRILDAELEDEDG